MNNIVKTNSREQFKKLDLLPRFDRSLVEYEKYHQFVGHAGVKYSMAVQATRGCPYGSGIFDARNLPISNKRIRYQDEIEDTEKNFVKN